MKILISLFVVLCPLFAYSQTLNSNITFEVGAKLGITPAIRINKTGGNNNAKFSSISFLGVGIETTFLKKINNRINIGSSFSAGMYPTYYKINYGGTDFLKVHPRKSTKASSSEDNLFVDLGIVLSYQIPFRKQRKIRFSITPKIHVVPFPAGNSGMELIYPDSTKQTAYEISYTRDSHKNLKGGCNLSINYIKEKNAYFYVGLYASIVPSSFKGDYVVFPNTSDYAYGTVAIRLSSFGIKLGVGFKHWRKR